MSELVIELHMQKHRRLGYISYAIFLIDYCYHLSLFYDFFSFFIHECYHFILFYHVKISCSGVFSFYFHIYESMSFNHKFHIINIV